MVGDGEALFGKIIATGVPNDMFTRSGTRIILAIKIRGMKPALLPDGSVSVPYGEYIGSYFCQSKDCEEFYGPPR